MLECLIIGGGPAGLTAATYLGRFRRNIAVVDDGHSRMQRIPIARNVPGFPGGIAGRRLHAQMLEQATLYGARFVPGRAGALERREGGFLAHVGDEKLCAASVLIATGSKLVEPDVVGLEEAVSCARIRYCPICDGLETDGKSVAVVGARPEGIKEAVFLSRFARKVLYVANSLGALPDDASKRVARAGGVEIACAPLNDIVCGDDAVLLRLKDGSTLAVDILYPCLGCTPQADLAGGLGARIAAEGGIVTDAHQRTSVTGLYAAGDVLQGLDQISSACGQAAIAATTIHNDLCD
jgi:thioredoxin reductase (NADPH)